MTLDVTIGRIRLELKDLDTDAGSNISHHLTVSQCPDAKKDICDKHHTLYPKESHRSGSWDFWRFFKRHEELNIIYQEMRYFPNSNDKDIALIGIQIHAINALNEEGFTDEKDKDRLTWLKYWCNKAIKLYGNEAAIQFS